MKSFPNIPFIAIVFIVIGTDFLLEQYNYFTDWNEVGGAILGIQAVLLFLYAWRDHSSSKAIWGGVFALSAATLFFPRYFDRFFWHDVWDYCSDYWPVALIVLGLWLVFKSFKRSSEPVM